MDMITEFLDGCKEKYENGNQWALMQALYVCAREGASLPKWVAHAYVKAYEAARTGHAKSWDDVFGSPYPKGTHFRKVIKHHEILWPLYSRAKEIVQTNPNQAIDESLFEQVGEEFNIGKTLASEYYYEAKDLSNAIGCD
jgi:hypothetical protein